MVAASLGFSLPGSRLWRKYNASLRCSPVATKSATCMAAYIVGDLSAQISSHRGRRLSDRLAAVNYARTARMALYGLLWCGPAGHGFYRWLDKVLMPRRPASLAAIAGKVTVDQMLFAPISTAVFFAWANIAAATPRRIKADMSEKFVPSVRAAWALWIPAMTINMALVPPPMRILWINAMAIVWTNILSSMATSDTPVALPEALPLAALAEQLCSETSSPAQRSARGTRDLQSRSAAGRTPRSTKDSHPTRSPRGTQERHAPCPMQQEASGVVPPRRSGSFDCDTGLAWLLGVLRGEEEETEARNSLCESSTRENELPAPVSHTHRCDVWGGSSDDCDTADDLTMASAAVQLESDLDSALENGLAVAV